MISEQKQDSGNTQSLQPWSTPTLQRLAGAENTEKSYSTVESHPFEMYGPS